MRLGSIALSSSARSATEDQATSRVIVDRIRGSLLLIVSMPKAMQLLRILTQRKSSDARRITAGNVSARSGGHTLRRIRLAINNPKNIARYVNTAKDTENQIMLNGGISCRNVNAATHVNTADRENAASHLQNPPDSRDGTVNENNQGPKHATPEQYDALSRPSLNRMHAASIGKDAMKSMANAR